MSSLAVAAQGTPGTGPAGATAGSGRVLFAPREPTPPGPDAASDVARYRRWIADRLAARADRGRPPSDDCPRIALLLVVDHPRPQALRRCLRAVAHQSDRCWELSLAVVGEPGPAAGAVLHEQLGGLPAGRWRRRDVAPGTSVPAAATVAQQASDAPFVAVLGQHDVLTDDAVALLRQALADPEVDMAYGDHDRLDDFGGRGDPTLAPDWSPDLLLGLPYLGRPVALRRRTLLEAGGIEVLDDGDWAHDLVLRVGEKSRRVAHVPEVLCGTASPYATPLGAPHGGADAGSQPGAVVRALARRAEAGRIEPGPVVGSWRVHRRPSRPVTVSAVIPLRDEPRLLRACVDSVRATTEGTGLQLVLVDNGSEDPETLSLLERLGGEPDTVVVRDDRPFNWAALNNQAISSATGDIVVFLNNDVEAQIRGWLDRLTAHALRPGVGVVGARLLYPGGRLQHGGMVVGMGGAAGHVLAGLAGDQPGYLGMAALTRECTAVTGACLATRRAVFEELGGFDEDLGLDLNDVDFCLRASRAGYRVIYEPLAELVHRESPSRGTSQSVPDIIRFLDRWESQLATGDPFFNPNLTRTDASCALRRAEEEEWWYSWRSALGSS